MSHFENRGQTKTKKEMVSVMHFSKLPARKLILVFALSWMALASRADQIRLRAPILEAPGFPSFFDVFVEIDLPPIAFPGPPVPGPAGGTIGGVTVGGGATVAPLGPDGSGFIDVEMLQLQLTGPGIMIRESPTRPSLGKMPNGSTITSFFDVFVELSVDDGQSWIPYDQPLQQTVPDGGATAAMLGASLAALAGLRRKRVG